MKTLRHLFLTIMFASTVLTAQSQTCATFYWTGGGLTLTFVDSNYCGWAYSPNSIWDFGDSTAQDTGATVNHTFASYGTYLVTLTCNDSSFTTNVDSSIYVVVGSAANPGCASFTNSVTNNYVAFTNTSNCPSANNWLWDFGDGTSGTASSPAHVYNATGSYIVKMKAFNGVGLIDSVIDTVSITSLANCAGFTSNVVYANVSFTNTSSCPGNNSYLWSFGDGNFSSNANPNHMYNATGTYFVTQYVYAAGSIIDSTKDSVVISTITTGCASFSVNVINNNQANLNSTSTCPNQGSVNWNFGDGQTGGGFSTSHVYNSTGTYKVKMWIYDSSSVLLDTTHQYVTINSLPNSVCASFNYSKSMNQVGFSSTSACSGQAHYYWDFGDNTNDSGATTSHTYTSIGTYVATLYVYDSNHVYIDSTFDTISITTLPSSCATFLYGQVGNNFNFWSTSSCPNQANYLWNFGDGTFGNGSSVNKTYANSGIYTVSMSVWDSNFVFIDSVVDSVYVNASPPVNCAAFTYTVSNNQVNFSSTSTCTRANAYNWVFGDGNYGVGSTVSHTYAATGTYTVLLAVMDSSNTLIDSVMDTVNITTLPPTCSALFSKAQAVDSNNNPVPGHLVITDQSTGSNLSYLWTFGDGDSSTAQNPTHTYAGNGPYVLCLTVSNSNCTDTYCDTLSVDSSGIIMKRKPGFTIHVGGYTPGTGTGIAEAEKSIRKVFPIPFNDQLNISLGSIDTETTLRIYGVSGRLFIEERLGQASGDQNIELDTRKLESGVYLLQIISQESAETVRIIKR